MIDYPYYQEPDQPPLNEQVLSNPGTGLLNGGNDELPNQPLPPLLEKYSETLHRVTFRLPKSTIKLMEEKIERHRWGMFANDCIRHFLK